MTPRTQKRGDDDVDEVGEPSIEISYGGAAAAATADESTPLVAASVIVAPQHRHGHASPPTDGDEEEGGILDGPIHSRRGGKDEHRTNTATRLCGSRSGDDAAVWRDEVRGMTSLAVPVVVTFLLEMIPGLVSIVLVGHCPPSSSGGDDESSMIMVERYVDATSLAVVYTNMLGMSLGIGLSTALDTLCSQAVGASEHARMGVYLQTGMVVLSVVTVVLYVPFRHSETIFRALGQPDDVSDLASESVRILYYGVPFVFLYELLRRVLQAQNVAMPMVVVACLANAINGALGYHLVYNTEWGWLGASVSRTLCNFSFAMFLVLYLMWSRRGNTFWNGLHLRAAVSGIRDFLALGVPGMLQLCFEWWAFECLSLLCGWIRPTSRAVVDMGANAVVMNASSMVYMLYLGLSISGNVRIGNALGANDPNRARLVSYIVVGAAVLAAFVSAGFLLTFRSVLPFWFTTDEDIDDASRTLIVVAAAFQLPDAINAAVQGIFRGSGRQTLGAKLNFVAYYGLGIPLGCWLAFGFGEGVVGLWLGMTAGLLLIAVTGTALVVRSDWSMLAKDAQERVTKH